MFWNRRKRSAAEKYKYLICDEEQINETLTVLKSFELQIEKADMKVLELGF